MAFVTVVDVERTRCGCIERTGPTERSDFNDRHWRLHALARHTDQNSATLEVTRWGPTLRHVKGRLLAHQDWRSTDGCTWLSA